MDKSKFSDINKELIGAITWVVNRCVEKETAAVKGVKLANYTRDSLVRRASTLLELPLNFMHISAQDLYERMFTVVINLRFRNKCNCSSYSQVPHVTHLQNYISHCLKITQVTILEGKLKFQFTGADWPHSLKIRLVCPRIRLYCCNKSIGECWEERSVLSCGGSIWKLRSGSEFNWILFKYAGRLNNWICEKGSCRRLFE